MTTDAIHTLQRDQGWSDDTLLALILNVLEARGTEAIEAMYRNLKEIADEENAHSTPPG